MKEAPGKDIDTLIKALYDSISGPAGQERKWEQMRVLFFDRAHMIRTDVLENGSPQAVVRDVDEYIWQRNSARRNLSVSKVIHSQ